MPRFRLAGLHTDVVRRLVPFLEDAHAVAGDGLLSTYLFGSAITRDYAPGRSDLNTLFVFDRLDRPLVGRFFRTYWSYGRYLIAPPILMPRDHLLASVDVLPMQLLDLKLAHHCLYGEDFLAKLHVRREHLRLECEREARRLFLDMQRRLIAHGGDATELREALRQISRRYLPLFRAILVLLGRRIPSTRAETVLRAGADLGVDAGPVHRAEELLAHGVRVDVDDLRAVYVDLYGFVEEIATRLDGLEARED
ncbi:MAG: hypothetical protein HYZ53_21355 [Planctomycetes bacterium]|nr:hypothetical protein [Planctomycetota bacterium]